MKRIVHILSCLILAGNVTHAQWSVENLSVGRYQHAGASAGAIAMFGGGLINSNATMASLSAVVDIYNTSTQSWSVSQLSLARTDLNAASAGNKILFAGGRKDYVFPYNFSTLVDIYDVSLGTWSVAQLSAPRSQLTAVSAGSKCLFAGGFYFSGFNTVSSDTVDIYDAVTNTWSITHLPTARHLAAGAYANGKVYFAGGQTAGGNGNTVDIYDIASGTWNSIPFPGPRRWLNGGSIGDLVFFAGGDVSVANADRIDIYNTVTGQWTLKMLSIPKQYIEIAALGNKIYFSGGSNSGYFPQNSVDIYDLSTNTWTTHTLSSVRSRHAAVAVVNRIMFAGGTFVVQGGLPLASVDVFTDNSVGLSETGASPILSVFPNPVHDVLTFHRPMSFDSGRITVCIYEVTGKMVLSQILTENSVEIDMKALPGGVYYAYISDEKHLSYKTKVIKY